MIRIKRMSKNETLGARSGSITIELEAPIAEARALYDAFELDDDNIHNARLARLLEDVAGEHTKGKTR